MKHAIEIQKAIINQLTGAGFQLETLSAVQIRELSFRWTERFIGKKTAPGIASYKWHIFSYGLTQSFTGDEATNLYQKQHPVDTYIFNENLSFGLICYKNTFLPKVQLKIPSDIYFCHYNLKWTYVLTHESPSLGPFFSS